MLQKARGIDWKFLLSQNGLDLGTQLNTQTQTTTTNYCQSITI